MGANLEHRAWENYVKIEATAPICAAGIVASQPYAENAEEWGTPVFVSFSLR